MGSFRLDAAQHTAGLAGLNADAVLDALAGLVDKSLVKLEQIEPPRYRLAETTRLYAWERLIDCGETDAAQQGHVRFMSAFIQEAYNTWLITNETEWRQRVEPELGNLRAALHWAFAASADVAAGIAMAASALPIWLHRDAHFQAEGLRCARQAICLLSPAVPRQIEARLWFASALLRPYDQLVEKAAELERSVILARALGGGEQLCHSLVEQGRLLARMGRGCDADSTLDEAESMMNSVAPQRLRGLNFMARAMLRQATGDLMGASRMHRRAAAVMLACGAESLALCTMNNLADAAWAQGDLDGAVDGFSRAVELARRYPLAGADTVGVPLGNWAAVLFEQGKVEQGSALIDEALTLLRKADKAWELCDALSVRLVLQSRNRDAAQVQGFVDAVYAASSEARQPNEQRLRDQVFDRLRESFDDGQLRQLHSAGAQLTEDAALCMAL